MNLISVSKKRMSSEEDAILKINTVKGGFSLNAAASALLNVQHGDYVQFLNDPDTGKDYIAKGIPVTIDGEVIKTKTGDVKMFGSKLMSMTKTMGAGTILNFSDQNRWKDFGGKVGEKFVVSISPEGIEEDFAGEKITVFELVFEG